MGKRLKDLIRKVSILSTVGDMNQVVEGIAMDSRRVRPGDIFACVPGFKVDGHDFADQALKAGARALLVEKILPLDVPQILISNVRQGVGILAAEIYDYPSSKLELVGVTGTNGKTTITHLIEKIGANRGKKVGLIGTLGSRIAGRSVPGERTTPEAVEIQALLSQMVQEGVELAVMEVSSHALDLGRVNGCEFDAGIFTNLTQDHLDYHKTMDDYREAKAKLFAELKGGVKSPKWAILNRDDGAFERMCKVSAAPVISYGIEQPADFKAEAVKVTPEGVSFTVKFGSDAQDVVYRTPGFFSVYNALAAFAWAVTRGYGPQDVASSLEEISGVPGRFESIRCGQPFQVIVDYAHTPDGLENVLRTARFFTKGKLITVFGCGGDRDRSKRPIMGKVASEWSDYVVVTSDNPRTEDPDSIIKEILAGVKGVSHTHITDRREAIITACREAKAGDTVLIAGKGHETYQIIGKDVLAFDDREVARECLRGLGYA